MSDKSRKFWIRLMAIILAALMVGGTVYTMIASLLV